MSRIWSSGFELNSTSNGVEVTTQGNGSSIDSTVFRSGAYSWKVTLSVATSLSSYQYKASDTQGDFYYRTYLYITTLPGSTVQIFTTFSSAASARKVAIRLTSTGTLQLYNQEDATQIGSDSSALNTGQWYRIELRVDTTTLATTAVDARLDGSSFASGTINLANAIRTLQWGAFDTNVTTTLNFDDIAINDSSGSFQNSWPGAGEIKHLKPNAVGDNSQWTPTSGDNYTNVDEVTPDDATTLVNNISVVNTLDDYNLEASGLTADDSITLVQVGARLRQNDVACTDKLRIKASSGGTVESSAGINQADTSWHTNAAALPFNYSLTLYDLPGASTTPWAASNLDTAQIGVEHTGGTTLGTDVSTEWLLVEYVTNGALTTSTSTTTTSTSTTSTTSSTSTTTTSTSSSTSTTSTTRSTSTTSTTRSTSTTSTTRSTS